MCCNAREREWRFILSYKKLNALSKPCKQFSFLAGLAGWFKIERVIRSSELPTPVKKPPNNNSRESNSDPALRHIGPELDANYYCPGNSKCFVPTFWEATRERIFFATVTDNTYALEFTWFPRESQVRSMGILRTRLLQRDNSGEYLTIGFFSKDSGVSAGVRVPHWLANEPALFVSTPGVCHQILPEISFSSSVLISLGQAEHSLQNGDVLLRRQQRLFDSQAERGFNVKVSLLRTR